MPVLATDYVIPISDVFGKVGQFITDRNGNPLAISGNNWHFGASFDVNGAYLTGGQVGDPESEAISYAVFHWTMPANYVPGEPFSVVITLMDEGGTPPVVDDDVRQLSVNAIRFTKTRTSTTLITDNEPQDIAEVAATDYTFTARQDAGAGLLGLDLLEPGDLIAVQIKTYWFSTTGVYAQPTITQVKVVL